MGQEVASLAEAWIETSPRLPSRNVVEVASLAEAWIETVKCAGATTHPLVASLAEAWIETLDAALVRASRPGRLPRGGVDRNISLIGVYDSDNGSPPSRRRGSKLLSSDKRLVERLVASLAEAWIETWLCPWLVGRGIEVASLAEAWIETS